MTSSQLGGLRVLDVATLYPAPLLAAMLGDLGADVVKVEPPGGDPLRSMGPGPWSIVGRNKRSVVVDVETEPGLARLHELIGVADIVVFNQSAQVLHRWDCSDDEIGDRNAECIVVHVSCFGTSGPYADRVGNGTLAEAFVGLPADVGVPLGDTAGAMHGVAQVLAALFARERGGGGAVVDVALYEAVLPFVAPRAGGADTSAMVRRRFVAGDGRDVAVSATTDSQLRRLSELAGPDVAAWVSERDAEAAVEQLAEARVPAVLVHEFHFEPDGIVPTLGEHTTEVVEEWLGGPA